jgi:hypothetical protein
MSNSEALEGLIKKLQECDLSGMAGGLLYSGISTLAPGRLYVLGYNPGGDPNVENDSPIRQLTKLSEQSPHWNEYIDGIWRPGGRVCAAGAAPMQTRVQKLIEGIGLSTRTVCASNLIFVRSRVSSHLYNQMKLAELCWPVHQYILGLIRPAAILCIGGSPVFEFIRNKGRLVTGPEQYPAGHGTWKCHAGQVQINDQMMAIVSVPHLARYAIDRHGVVIRWAREKLNL